MRSFLRKFRFSRLHVKMFLYFTVTLVLAELLVFGAYRLGFRRDRFSRFEGLARNHAQLLREAVSGRLGPLGVARSSPSKAAQLNGFVEQLARSYNGRVWLMLGQVKLADSQTGAAPRFPERRIKDFGDFSVAWGRGGRIHVRLPLRPKDPAGPVLFFRADRDPDGAAEVVPALLGLGLAFLVLALPVARLVTSPVARLRDTALRFASGQLKERAPEFAKDEIGELARSFNLMAERIERMLENARQLSAHVSHELRSPLARIRLAEELLRSELPAGTTAARLDTIRAEIELLDGLVGRILQYANLDRQEPEPPAPLNVARLLEEVVGEFGSLIEHKRVLVSRSENGRTVEHFFGVAALGSALHLRTALRAALENAIRYCPAGGSLQLDCSLRDGRLALQIANECDRLPDDFESIFEPFRRASAGASAQSRPAADDPASEGHGLGLAILRRAMDLAGGQARAWGESEGGRSRFVLALSLPTAPKPRSASKATGTETLRT